MRGSIVVGLLLVSLSPVVAQGQTCLGLPSFARVPAHLSASVSSGDDITHLGGRLSWGSSALGPFASVEAALVDVDGIDETAFSVGGAVGLQIAAKGPNGNGAGKGANRARPRSANQQSSSVRPMQWCPMMSVDYQSGPNFDILGESFDMSALTVGAGASLGLPIEASPNLQLIPTGGFGLAYTKVSADFGPMGGSESDIYGVLSLGVGILMNETISVKPFLGIPIGLDGADSRVGIMASFGLGQR